MEIQLAILKPDGINDDMEVMEDILHLEILVEKQIACSNKDNIVLETDNVFTVLRDKEQQLTVKLESQ